MSMTSKTVETKLLLEIDNGHKKVHYFLKQNKKNQINTHLNPCFCSVCFESPGRCHFVICSCCLYFPVSVRHNKWKIWIWIFSASLMNRVSMNGKDCKGEVTEACYWESWDYLCIFFIISTVTVSKVTWTVLQFFTRCKKSMWGNFFLSSLFLKNIEHYQHWPQEFTDTKER